MIKVWMPELWMENHRTQADTDALFACLRAEGVECLGERYPRDFLGKEIHAAFVGSWVYYEQSREFRRLFPGVPVVQYNWDIYPFQVNARTDPRTDHTGRARPTVGATRWGEYIQELKHATEVWVPSEGVVKRTHEFCGPVPCRVVRCNAFFWTIDRPDDWRHGDYVMDVLRGYPGEPMTGAVEEVCRGLGVPYIAAGHQLSWVDFKRAVAGARLLVSSYNEASTGGLSLIEGYAHGKDVLISDSPMNGAGEYFGRREGVYYFDHRKGKIGLRDMIRHCWEGYRAGDHGADCVVNRRFWSARHFAVDRFAARAADELRRVVHGRG